MLSAPCIDNIQDTQGKRSDLEEIEEMLLKGMTPQEILDKSFRYYKYEKMILHAYMPLSSQREVKKLARYSGFLYSFSSSPMDCMFLIWTVATNARPFVSVENPIMINPPENVVKFTVIRNVTAGA